MSDKIKFDQSRYVRDLKTALNGVLEKSTKNIYRQAQVNLASLKARKVDVQYVPSFASALKMVNHGSANKFAKRIFMKNDGQNDSFRALYYEYGTGVNMLPPKGWSPSGDYTWNVARPKGMGEKIYYRDRAWVDLGGNYHPKGGVKPGVKKLIPRKNVYGHPIQAQFWFRRALMTGSRDIDRLVLQAVKSVPITAYIKIRDVHVRM